MSKNTCCAQRCSNTNKKGYSLFRLPTCEQIRNTWKSAIKLHHCAENSRICEVHFSQDQVYFIGRTKQLHPTTIPSFSCTCVPEPAIVSQKNTILNEHSYSQPSQSQFLRRIYRGFNHKAICCCLKEPYVKLNRPISGQKLSENKKTKDNFESHNLSTETVISKLNEIEKLPVEEQNQRKIWMQRKLMNKHDNFKKRVANLKQSVLHTMSFNVAFNFDEFCE